jgi:DNA-directed RNA polymerase specialized sigma24 family protein
MISRGFDTQRERDALDRHITGNYGEDFFREDPDDEVEYPDPADPAVCIAEAAKEAIDTALSAVTSGERDSQLLRAIQQIAYLRSY